MKQKEIYIDPSLNLETQKMVEMYFAVKTVNRMEGFVYSEEEFLKKYKNSYMINDLRTSKYYAVYRDRCQNCDQVYELIISNRAQLFKYLNSNNACCNRCSICQSSIE